MKRGRALGVLALGAVLAGCSTITSGRVADKGYDPSYQYVTFICGAYSTQGACTVQVPVINQVPECWRLDLVNGEETGSVCVSEVEWNAARQGDRWGEA